MRVFHKWLIAFSTVAFAASSGVGIFFIVKSQKNSYADKDTNKDKDVVDQSKNIDLSDITEQVINETKFVFPIINEIYSDNEDYSVNYKNISLPNNAHFEFKLNDSSKVTSWHSSLKEVLKKDLVVGEPDNTWSLPIELQKLEIKLVANTGYKFINNIRETIEWSTTFNIIDSQNESNSTPISIDGNKLKNALSFSGSSGSGSVTIDKDFMPGVTLSISSLSTNNGSLSIGDNVTILATANAGFIIIGNYEFTYAITESNLSPSLPTPISIEEKDVISAVKFTGVNTQGSFKITSDAIEGALLLASDATLQKQGKLKIDDQIEILARAKEGYEISGKDNFILTITKDDLEFQNITLTKSNIEAKVSFDGDNGSGTYSIDDTIPNISLTSNATNGSLTHGENIDIIATADSEYLVNNKPSETFTLSVDLLKSVSISKSDIKNSLTFNGNSGKGSVSIDADYITGVKLSLENLTNNGSLSQDDVLTIKAVANPNYVISGSDEFTYSITATDLPTAPLTPVTIDSNDVVNAVKISGTNTEGTFDITSDAIEYISLAADTNTLSKQNKLTIGDQLVIIASAKDGYEISGTNTFTIDVVESDLQAKDIILSLNDVTAKVSFTGDNGSGTYNIDDTIPNISLSSNSVNDSLTYGGQIVVFALADSGYLVNGKANDGFTITISNLTPSPWNPHPLADITIATQGNGKYTATGKVGNFDRKTIRDVYLVTMDNGIKIAYDSESVLSNATPTTEAIDIMTNFALDFANGIDNGFSTIYKGTLYIHRNNKALVPGGEIGGKTIFPSLPFHIDTPWLNAGLSELKSDGIAASTRLSNNYYSQLSTAIHEWGHYEANMAYSLSYNDNYDYVQLFNNDEVPKNLNGIEWLNGDVDGIKLYADLFKMIKDVSGVDISQYWGEILPDTFTGKKLQESIDFPDPNNELLFGDWEKRISTFFGVTSMETSLENYFVSNADSTWANGSNTIASGTASIIPNAGGPSYKLADIYKSYKSMFAKRLLHSLYFRNNNYSTFTAKADYLFNLEEFLTRFRILLRADTSKLFENMARLQLSVAEDSNIADSPIYIYKGGSNDMQNFIDINKYYYREVDVHFSEYVNYAGLIGWDNIKTIFNHRDEIYKKFNDILFNNFDTSSVGYDVQGDVDWNGGAQINLTMKSIPIVGITKNKNISFEWGRIDSNSNLIKLGYQVVKDNEYALSRLQSLSGYVPTTAWFYSTDISTPDMKFDYMSVSDKYNSNYYIKIVGQDWHPQLRTIYDSKYFDVEDPRIVWLLQISPPAVPAVRSGYITFTYDPNNKDVLTIGPAWD